ncbi:uncharacterized protein LOC134531044 isoform X1 [Bacillus rossius redtenbacheri]|uniref:uncharacterized protein LOC134531044 isoform X1 n=1 Tax=Bacillus rossius redtenbacheri TaxID=93214 RepID=UPI002FDDA41E
MLQPAARLVVPNQAGIVALEAYRSLPSLAAFGKKKEIKMANLTLDAASRDLGCGQAPVRAEPQFLFGVPRVVPRAFGRPLPRQGCTSPPFPYCEEVSGAPAGCTSGRVTFVVLSLFVLASVEVRAEPFNSCGLFSRVFRNVSFRCAAMTELHALALPTR